MVVADVKSDLSDLCQMLGLETDEVVVVQILKDEVFFPSHEFLDLVRDRWRVDRW